MDVKTLCLGILSLGDATGYEIKKRFGTRYSHFFAASFGSIYPALTRLTDEGLVSYIEHAQAKRPDKKVYSITPAGRLAFFDALRESPGRDRVRSEFFAMLMFADLMPTRRIAELMDERLDFYRGCIANMESHDHGAMSPGEAFVHGFGLAFYKMAAAHIEENRHAVEGEVLLAQTAEPAYGAGTES